MFVLVCAAVIVPAGAAYGERTSGRQEVAPSENPAGELEQECIQLLEEGGALTDCYDPGVPTGTVLWWVALGEAVVLALLVALGFRLPWRRKQQRPSAP